VHLAEVEVPVVRVHFGLAELAEGGWVGQGAHVGRVRIADHSLRFAVRGVLDQSALAGPGRGVAVVAVAVAGENDEAQGQYGTEAEGRRDQRSAPARGGGAGGGRVPRRLRLGPGDVRQESADLGGVGALPGVAAQHGGEHGVQRSHGGVQFDDARLGLPVPQPFGLLTVLPRSGGGSVVIRGASARRCSGDQRVQGGGEAEHVRGRLGDVAPGQFGGGVVRGEAVRADDGDGLGAADPVGGAEVE
jgi:hypothetical protein